MLGLLGWGIFGALWYGDNIKNLAENKERRAKAKEAGETYYQGLDTKYYLVSNNRPCTVKTNILGHLCIFNERGIQIDDLDEQRYKKELAQARSEGKKYFRHWFRESNTRYLVDTETGWIVNANLSINDKNGRYHIVYYKDYSYTKNLKHDIILEKYLNNYLFEYKVVSEKEFWEIEETY